MESETKEDFLKYSPSDPELIDKIVNKIKSKGIFDQFRKECLADVDTKPAYQNLQRRVNGTVNGFLSGQKWPCPVNKIQLRECLRKHTVQQSFLEVGVDRIVDQVVMPKIYSVFHPQVEEIVYELLGLEKPKPKPQTPPDTRPKPLLDLKPKPQSLLDLKLDFQNFKKSLQESITADKGKVLESPSSSKQNEEAGCSVKVEEDSQVEHPDGANTPPPLETNGVAELDAPPEPVVSSPPSQMAPPELVKNDDDSNTIDEMPLLAASVDMNSNGATTPVFGSARDDIIPNVQSSSNSESLSLPISQPRMDLDNSTDLLSSFKSECKESQLKKFDNFSNLGEKLKQSDVNLRETTPVKHEEITEESSELTKSSEHDSESIELNMEVHSDSNTSAMDSSRLKNEVHTPTQYSDDSNHCDKSKSKSQDSKNDVKSYSSKQMESTESKSRSSLDELVGKPVIKLENDVDSNIQNQEVDEKEHHKSKLSDSKARHKDVSKDKSKSFRDDKCQKSQESHSSERNGKQDADKHDGKKDKGGDSDKKNSKYKNDKTKTAAPEEERRKKKDERSHHHSKEYKDSRSHKKAEGHDGEGKDSFKSPEKEKKDSERSRSDKHKHRSDSSSRSNRHKSGERKNRDERKKDDKKEDDRKKDDKKEDDRKKDDKKEDDRKKDSRKRKSGKCDEDDLKNKNSRRSSDRDSNGNAGGGSDRSKPTSSSQSHKKSSKSEQKTRSRYKDPSNSDSVEVEAALQVADEVDLILLQINNSIENEQNRLDVREILNDPSVSQTKKPKIAKNFSEIKKIMQVRKNIDKMSGADAVYHNDHVTDKSSETEHFSSEGEGIADDDKDSSLNDVASVSDEIELKKASVVLTDVLKDSSLKSMKNIDWNGVSIFLGTSNEIIVGVETCDAGSSSRDSTSCDDVPESPNESVLHDRPIDSQEVDCLEANENVTMFIDGNSQSKECETAKEPLGVSACSNRSAPVMSDENLTKGNTPDDDNDKLSVKSGKSDSSSLKDVAESIDTSDCDSKTSIRKRDKPIKRKSSDSPLPSRSTTRTNAGARMYAILEEVSSSKHSNAPADRVVKKNTFKSRSNSDVEKLSGPNSPKVDSESSDIGEQPSLAEEVPITQDRADDGSDVSNKENDEQSGSGSGRLKGPNVDSSALVETRGSRRMNPGVDKPEENLVKSCESGKSNITKTRAPGKNITQEPELTKDENPGISCLDVGKTTRRSAVSLLNSRIKDSDDPWNIKANCSSSSSRSGSSDSLSILDKAKSNDTVRKSMECLQMEKENLTVLQTQSSELHLSTLSSPRRKSCPDILHPREYCENKDSVRMCDTTASDVLPHSPVASGTDAKTNISKPNALSKPVVGPKKQYEYFTRNINSRRKSVSTAKQTDFDVTSVLPECEDDCKISKSLDPNNQPRGSNESVLCAPDPTKLDSPALLKSKSGEEAVVNVVDRQEQLKCQGDGSNATGIPVRKSNRRSKKPQLTEGLQVDKQSFSSNSKKNDQQFPDGHPSQCSVQSEPGCDDYIDEGFNATSTVGKSLYGESSRNAISSPVPVDAPVKERVQKESPSHGLTAQAKNMVSLVRPSTRRTKMNNGSLVPTGLREDSSCSSSEFRGFSEGDGDSDSEEGCLGFSDLEIRKAVAQLRQLTHFISKCPAPDANGKRKPIPLPQDKKKGSLDSVLDSEKPLTPLATPRAKKRKLSLSFSPDKDKKELLVSQCKAESKDSGLCESPEHAYPNTCQKPVVADRRVPAGPGTVPDPPNGMRTKPTRAAASRQERKNVTETLTKTDIAKNSRNLQRYCASDLYKPRPSFARDVRAVKRTTSTEVSALGRVKKRSR